MLTEVFSSVVFPSLFCRTACGSGRKVEKRLSFMARTDFGIHNDMDVQALSPCKTLLSALAWHGFIVPTCLSFKQIHKKLLCFPSYYMNLQRFLCSLLLLLHFYTHVLTWVLSLKQLTKRIHWLNLKKLVLARQTFLNYRESMKIVQPTTSSDFMQPYFWAV